MVDPSGTDAVVGTMAELPWNAQFVRLESSKSKEFIV